MCVRSSNAFYGIFNLDMGRSPGFGSAWSDYNRPVKTWFPFGSIPLVFNLARPGNSPDRSTKSTRLRFKTLPQLVNTGFQVLFHSPPGVLFTFPSQYCTLSVTRWCLALRGGPRVFSRGFTCPGLLRIPPRCAPASGTGLSPPLAGLPRPFPSHAHPAYGGPKPRGACAAV